jgi:hypothetical protein
MIDDAPQGIAHQMANGRTSCRAAEAHQALSGGAGSSASWSGSAGAEEMGSRSTPSQRDNSGNRNGRGQDKTADLYTGIHARPTCPTVAERRGHRLTPIRSQLLVVDQGLKESVCLQKPETDCAATVSHLDAAYWLSLLGFWISDFI